MHCFYAERSDLRLSAIRSVSRSFSRSDRRQDFVRIALDRKAEYAAQVDALGPSRCYVANELGRNRTTTMLCPMIEDSRHLSRVPGHDDIGAQVVRAVKLVVRHPNEGTAMMASEPLESKHITGASSNWRYVGPPQLQAGVGSNVVATAHLTPASHL
jgi:hypothetical protein